MKIAKKRYFYRAPECWKVLSGAIKDDAAYIIEDINYFKQKITRSLNIDPVSQAKYQTLIDQLEDSLIIYRITQGRR